MKNCVFDIETIPDLEACAKAHVDPAEGFPPWPLHQIMCVSVLTVERSGWDDVHFGIETFSRADLSERAIVAEVERIMSSANVLTSYNGRCFDVPVLLARAAVTGELVPTISKAAQRSVVGFHDDVLDVITGYGAAVRPKLAHVCAAMSIPVKIEAAGEGVADLVREGDWARVARYCETDVVATWLLSEVWRSIHSPGHGEDRWRRLAAWIAQEQPRLEHLQPYLQVPTMPGGGRRFDGPHQTELRL